MYLSVRVYLYEDNNCDIDNAKLLFTGKTTSGKKVHIKKVDLDLHNRHDCDYQIVIKSFDLTEDENDYVLICKSSCVSASSSNTILNLIEKVIENNENGDNCFDLFYLSKWLDRCDLYSNVYECDSGLKIVNTFSPNGIHCLMFSPKGREKFMKYYSPEENPIRDMTLSQVLNNRIGQRCQEYVNLDEDETFIAITTTPTLINYDIINGKGNKHNNLKLSECRDIPHPSKPEPTPTTSHMAFFWLLIIIIFVTLIAFIFVRYYIDKYNKPLGGFYPSPPKVVLPSENNLF